jgi:hypothetical protein
MNLFEMFDSEGPNKLTLVDALRDFLPIAIKNLKLDHIPKIKLVKSIPDANVPTFGRFVNEEKVITVVVANRNPVDILRTLAHEMVHYAQGEQHRLDGDSWHTGSPTENQAHEQAGIIMREFDQQFPEYLSAEPVILPENFADGKKPGRKGLAKRSGVDTKASVTDLRKTAKNSTGEKQRMAHWLANMKAGKK